MLVGRRYNDSRNIFYEVMSQIGMRKSIGAHRWMENLLSQSAVYSEVHQRLVPFLYDLLYWQRDVAERVEHLEDLLEVFGRDMPVHLQGSGDVGMS